MSAQHSWNPDLRLPPLELLPSLYSHSNVTMWLWVFGEQRDGFFTCSWAGNTEDLVHAGQGLCPCCASSLVVVSCALWDQLRYEKVSLKLHT